MDDVGLRQVRGVFLDAFLQGCSGETGRGFHLDGRNVVAAGDGPLGDEEVDFHPVVFVLSGRIGVEEEFAADSGEHLADDVHQSISLKYGDFSETYVKQRYLLVPTKLVLFDYQNKFLGPLDGIFLYVGIP